MEPLAGVLRFDLHMARLENSARELNFACNMDVIRQKIAESGTGDQALKLRLTLAPDGVATVAALSLRGSAAADGLAHRHRPHPP